MVGRTKPGTVRVVRIPCAQGAYTVGRCGLEERGSVLLLVLIMCLTLAATALALASMTEVSRLLATEDEHARHARSRLDVGLVSVVGAATELPVARALEVPGLSYARIDESSAEAPFSVGIVAGVAVEGGFLEVRARLERATDGIDLPDRVLVASRVSVVGDRLLEEIVQSSGPTGGVSLGSRCPLSEGSSPEEVEIGRAWGLDDGQWATLDAAARLTSSQVVAAPRGSTGRPYLSESQGGAAECPVLIVGGRDVPLDLSDLGDLYGVILAGELGVRLEGTTLHGGVFTSGEVRLGECGRVVDSPTVRRWASSASIPVGRLVPGTRREVVVATDG